MVEAAAALPPYTIAASNAVTVTYPTELYLPLPVAGTNVTTGSFRASLTTAGSILDLGSLSVITAR